MKYIIAKFETNYGLPVYRVRVRGRFLYSWVRSEAGEVLSFLTREDAHGHMRSFMEGAGVRQTRPDNECVRS